MWVLEAAQLPQILKSSTTNSNRHLAIRNELAKTIIEHCLLIRILSIIWKHDSMIGSFHIAKFILELVVQGFSRMYPVGCDHPTSVPNSNLAGVCYLKREQLFLFTFLFGYRNSPAKIRVGHK